MGWKIDCSDFYELIKKTCNKDITPYLYERNWLSRFYSFSSNTIFLFEIYSPFDFFNRQLSHEMLLAAQQEVRSLLIISEKWSEHHGTSPIPIPGNGTSGSSSAPSLVYKTNSLHNHSHSHSLPPSLIDHHSVHLNADIPDNLELSGSQAFIFNQIKVWRDHEKWKNYKSEEIDLLFPDSLIFTIVKSLPVDENKLIQLLFSSNSPRSATIPSTSSLAKFLTNNDISQLLHIISSSLSPPSSSQHYSSQAPIPISCSSITKDLNDLSIDSPPTIDQLFTIAGLSFSSFF